MMKWFNLAIGSIIGGFARYLLAGSVYQIFGRINGKISLFTRPLFIWLKKRNWQAQPVKGFIGFGAESHMHTTEILRLFEDLPSIIKMVDSEEKISTFLPYLDAMVQEGLITLEKVNVMMYRAGLKK